MNRKNRNLLRPDRRVGADFEAYQRLDGLAGLERALEDPPGITGTIEAADLRGLGGSGFPAHIKWRAMIEHPAAPGRVLICNGNEDEPGTYKDRLLLEYTPHHVIEGAMIAALAAGCDRLIFYINPDLGTAIKVMQAAVLQWIDSPWPGRVGKAVGRPLRLEILPASGHYIGGEETAAMEWVEGRFPFPRGKPPYPAESGVDEQPTLINNTETLANVSHILREGPDWFHALGIGQGSGTKLYSLSGDVLQPGVYELPMGIGLGELIKDYGGGMLQGKALKAIFTGGPSNTLLTGDDLDVPLDFESVRKRGGSLGTGAIIAISQGTSMVRRVAEYVGFFAHSSCGQCPSCKTGTFYISMLLEKINTGRGSRIDLDTLQDLCRILPGTGRCQLVDGVVKVLDSSFQHFLPEYEAALRR